MRMNGMYREDEVTRVDLLGYVNICKFIEEADVVLEQKSVDDGPGGVCAITKPEDGFNGQKEVADPFRFAQDVNPTTKVLVIYKDGTFQRFNMDLPKVK